MSNKRADPPPNLRSLEKRIDNIARANPSRIEQSSMLPKARNRFRPVIS